MWPPLYTDHFKKSQCVLSITTIDETVPECGTTLSACGTTLSAYISGNLTLLLAQVGLYELQISHPGYISHLFSV